MLSENRAAPWIWDDDPSKSAWRRWGWLLAASLAAAGIGLGWSFAFRTPSDEETRLMERLRQRPTEMTLRAARTFFAKHAPILKFEKAHFADQKDGRRWFLLCLDKRMLPLMREASRIGIAEQKAVRIEDFRARLERYRTRMSADERAQLNAAFATSEGQRLAKDAIHFFCGELSASDKTSLAPVIQEVVAILHTAGASASPAKDPQRPAALDGASPTSSASNPSSPSIAAASTATPYPSTREPSVFQGEPRIFTRGAASFGYFFRRC